MSIKAKQYNPRFNDFIKDCAFLNDFYTEIMSPNENPLFVGRDDVNESLKIVEKICAFADEAMRNESL